MNDSAIPPPSSGVGQILLKYLGFTVCMSLCAIVTMAVVEVYAKYRAEHMTRSIGSPDPETPRTIAAGDTLFIEEMTWMEVRDAMKAGKTTVLVASGGVEQCGPYLAMGKHNYVCRATTEAIARKLGNALIAPIVPFVPQGSIDPPEGHMKYAGTISLTEDTYRLLLTEIARCYQVQGFEHVIFLADSGSNRDGMEAVATELAKEWQGGKTTIHYIREYYNYLETTAWLDTQGVKQIRQGLHDDFATTAILMTVDPRLVRMEERLAAGNFKVNGIELAPAENTIAWGRKIVAYRADQTVAAIRRALSK